MSERAALKAMAITGGTQVVSVALSILRAKALAVLLGPAGIGLLSVFQTLQSVVQTGAGLGLGASGVREIAATRGDPEAVARVRRVLLWAHLLQGGLTGLAVWLWREPLAVWLLGDATWARDVGLVGVAVVTMLLGNAQMAVLRGFRRIADLGRVTVISALTATAAILPLAWWLGTAGLIWVVLLQPLATALAALWFLRRLPRPAEAPLGPARAWAAWRSMAGLGLGFMLSALATAAVLLVVRGRIAGELGLDAAGQFAAAWSIAMTYVGFLLSAMAADYYPRLSETIADRPAAHRMMNAQLQLSLALGGPILLALIGLAPWAIRLLYSDAFAPAAAMLQWQTVGNVLKLAAWPLGFALVAAARGRWFLISQLSFNAAFLGLVWIGLPVLGLQAVGPAFLLGYLVYFAAEATLARRLQGFRWEPLSRRLLLLHGGLAAGLLALARAAPVPAAALAAALAAATAVLGLRVVLAAIGPAGRLPSRLHAAFARIGWPVGPAP